MDIGRALPADVTRDLLEEVLSYKALYETLNRIVDGAVVELDDRARVVRFNPAAEALTGFSTVSLVGRPFAEIAEGVERALPPAAQIEPAAVRFAIADTQGSKTDVHGYAVALRSGERCDGWLLAFRSKRKVDEIEQLKTELVSTVSHELKTPLATIKAYTATLRQNPSLYEARRDEFLGVVEEQADRLSRLVDDMLLVSRVEAAQMLRRRAMLPLALVLDRVLAEVPLDPHKHPVERNVGDVAISGDPERLHDIFRNLIENAVKYSPQGGKIAVRAHAAGDRTIVDVRDEGIGIADADIPYIFDRFYRVENELSARTGGSGLGLFIVNALVRAHGGTIDVRSEPGAGTTFTLNFPVRA